MIKLGSYVDYHVRTSLMIKYQFIVKTTFLLVVMLIINANIENHFIYIVVIEKCSNIQLG